MRTKTLFSFLSIIFFSLLLIGQNLAQDKESLFKNIGKFTSVSENGNQKDIQGASTAIITSTNIGGKIGGFTHPYNGNPVDYWAGTFNGTVDGNAVNFYCIDIDTYLVYNEDYTDEGPTPIEMTYILNNYYPYESFPYNGSMGTEAKEASAIQAALWHYADGLDVATIGDADIQTRVYEILADANASSAVYPDYFTITPSSRVLIDGAIANFEVSAFDTDGNPFAGLNVNLSSTSGTLSASQVTTDANGVVAFTLEQNGGNLAIITANAQVVIPQGTQYFHVARPDGQQKLVLATPTTATGTATAEVSWNPQGTTRNLCAIDVNGDQHSLGEITITELFNGDINIKVTYAKTFNDNTYANKKDVDKALYVIGWPNDKHEFKNLTGSDKIQLSISDGNSDEVLNFEIDYIEDGQSTASGYGTRIESGDSPFILNHNSSLSRNFNDFGYVLEDHSPESDQSYSPDPNYPNWIFDMSYEVTISGAAFNGAGFGDVTVVEMHNSPHKLEDVLDKAVNPFYCDTNPIGSTLGDKVWNDTNNDGIQDANELGVSNVTVKLYSCADVLLKTTTTDGSGNYLFSDLSAGSYYVKFILPTGYVFSPKNIGNDSTVDSDADQVTGKTECITLSDNQIDLTWDAGLFVSVCYNTIGDYVWHDKNVNGIQDPSETGIENVKVELYKDGSLIASTNTTSTGYYEFTGLENGTYKVKIADANFNAGGVFESSESLKWYSTLEKQQCGEEGGDNDFDNDGISNGYDDDDDGDGINDDDDSDDDNDGINDDEDDDDDNDGISDDFDNDGDDDFDNDGISNNDDDDDDNDGINDDDDNDDDNDGINDDDDNDDDNDGINDDDDNDNDENDCNAKDSDGNEDNETTVVINCNDDFTIDFGFFKTCMTFIKTGPESVTAGDLINYSFSVINCGDLVLHGGATVYDPMLNPNGDHKLANAVVEPGATWTFTRSYSTTDADCGNTIVNEAWAIGHPQMPDGSYKEDIRYDDSHSVDVVCETKASLGDRVWYDDNENGIQDLGEDGIKNVTVNLYDCTDQFISSITTDDDGYYLFDNLEPGSYYVEFILPNGYLFTLQNEGNDSALDSDADEISGKTVCTDLLAGDVDLTWDAGMYVEAVNDFDLSIVKTASNTNPDDEALVTYTITVTNNSSVDGTNITVSDVLPAGLIYQSSSPAGYDDITGIWNVGDIAAGNSKSLDITVKVDYLSLGEAPIFDLGIAAPFNLFVLKDVVQPSSDTEGKVAVGRNAKFGSYSIGDKLPLSGGTEDVLIVGRKLTYTSGQVYGGNVVYGQYIDVQQINLCSDGSIRQENPVPVDFAQAETDLNALSNQLATKAATGTTTFEWGGLTLDGAEPILNVFEVDGNDLSAANSMTINVPNGSVVLVNISRWNVSWTGGLVVNGTAIGNVLYNFNNATQLQIQGIDIQGSILAPKAKVNFVTGVINGQMICKYFEGQGQMNISPFHGSIHGNPEITNCAEIQSYDQVDVDASNNISCAPVVVNVDFDPNNGDDSGDDGSQWVEAGGTGLNEMIWSMYQSNAGLYIGTVGGNIYLNNGPDFELLNEDMTVTYIWSLYEFGGNLYAGTELGLYRYDGSTWTLVDISGDVRAITSLNNVLYAAVWGGGVFQSSDNGATWNAMNEGLLMSGYAVQTLTATDNNLFVGTFALGVLKYDFSSSTWVELPVGYPFIWSLATDVDNNIYAATSGGGVYASTDEGDSWVQLNTGLPNMHIYSVSIYGNDIYVSTWSGGVYKFIAGSLGKADNGTPSVASTPITGSWSSLGMGGIEVSSIMVDANTQTLYAGTSSGTIYKKLDGVTDVNAVEAIPTEFGLEQNYPNPFNPSTKIEFSIAEAGLYAVKVFNVLGQEVAVVANQDFAAGKYTFNFDASNLTSGIYFYKLVGNNVNMTKKMMLLK